MVRFQGRGFGRGRGHGNYKGRSQHRSQPSSTQKSTSQKSTEKKTLSDHIYYVGSAKQASDFVTVTNFIISHIKINLGQYGPDVADAMEALEDIDFEKDKPVLRKTKITDKDVEDDESGQKGIDRDAEQDQFLNEFKIDYEAHKTRQKAYEYNKKKAAAILWKQCSPTMKSKVMSRTDYTTIKEDPIELLKAIRQHAMSYESTRCRMKTIVDALKAFVNFRQKEDESTIDYLRRFKTARDVFISHVGKDFGFPRVVEEDQEFKELEEKLANQTATVEEVKKKYDELNKMHMEKFYAYLYLENTDRARYGSILKYGSGCSIQFEA